MSDVLELCATHQYLYVALDPATTSPGAEVFGLCLAGHIHRLTDHRPHEVACFQITRKGLEVFRARELVS